MRKVFFVIAFTSTLCCAVLANVEKVSAQGAFADDAVKLAPKALDAAPSVFGGIALFFQDNPVVIGIVGIVFVSMLVYYSKNS
jgi:hypothetical protein